MTERKPPDVDVEVGVPPLERSGERGRADRRIRDAEARGLRAAAGSGQAPPARDLETPYDEMWWAGRKPAREGHSVLPPAPALRKEAEDALEAALAAPSERIRAEDSSRRSTSGSAP
ncbi:DnaJ family domain-containing protein [Streptomyces sp. NPDC058632]|uniref:DnaJ family domain-containing protein n=1 Tax=Streptomyces sp. NPDC058632 TaxID=3346567 RepID=UPI00365A03DA